MRYKTALGAAALLVLSACSSLGRQPVYPEEDEAERARREQIAAKAPHPNYIGTEEWYVWVDESIGLLDAQGHGPAHGSTEWCHAVHLKVTGFRADEAVACDRNWQRQIDRTLRNPRSLFDIF